jgi:nitrogen fixation protein NifU and related proteins
MPDDQDERLYEEFILRHFEEPFHRGLLADATHWQRVDNPVCGDSIQLELMVSTVGIIDEAWFTGTGCIISQAAASMLTEFIEGRALEELRDFSARNMLELFRARLTPRRQQCCLLAWKALFALLQSNDH